MVYAPLAFASATRLRVASHYNGSPELAAANLERALHAILPSNTAINVTPRYYDRLLRAGGFDRALANARVLSIAASVIVLIGLLGIGAGISQIVQMQQREIAVRMALGASAARVITHVVRRIVLLAAISLFGGTVVMLGISGAMAPLLVTLRRPDMLPHFVLAAGMFILCVAVALIAIGRIGRIDLPRALRVE
jgi:predicted lysophospholipase L1 biosynthesis ABC-type transport system permease subunit